MFGNSRYIPYTAPQKQEGPGLGAHTLNLGSQEAFWVDGSSEQLAVGLLRFQARSTRLKCQDKDSRLWDYTDG